MGEEVGAHQRGPRRVVEVPAVMDVLGKHLPCRGYPEAVALGDQAVFAGWPLLEGLDAEDQ